MNDFLENNINNVKEYLNFNKLCDTAKGIIFDWLFDDENHTYCVDTIKNRNIINSANTPIEQIFIISYYKYILTEMIYGEQYFNTPLPVIFSECIFDQESIVCNNKLYIADFVFDLSLKDKNGDFLFPKYKDLKYVIELDGFEYHSSKKQVNSDYEREQNLQSLGYKIIRFTGSQIFNDPHSCILKLVCIILNDIRSAYSKKN